MNALNQRGANGLVAEYVCAAELNRRLLDAGCDCLADQGLLDEGVDATVERVANELSPAQLDRAIAQGVALAEYVLQALTQDPAVLAMSLDPGEVLGRSIDVRPVGHQTSKGSSVDLVVEVLPVDDAHDESELLELSLKAYAGTVSSLGSKSARACLSRAFLGEARVSDEEFVERFGGLGQEFLDLFDDFKAVAKEFYASPAGTRFVDEYEARKGTRKVNNPLRRKEVGNYFFDVRGFKSEHRFAELFVRMFNAGVQSLRTEDDWAKFLAGMRFVLGFDRGVVTLNAIADDDGVVRQIDNSNETTAYGRVRRALVTGCSFRLEARPNSGNIGVDVQADGEVVGCLQLAIWKDATIQFKLDTRGLE